MDENQEEMEEWMKMWQANLEWTEELREDFASRRRKEAWSFVVGMIALLVLGVVLALSPQKPGFVGFIISTFAWVSLASAFYISISSYMGRKTETPLSPHGYLEKCQHNLAQKQRQIDWGQKMWPWMLVFLALCLGLIFMKSPFPRFLMIMFGLAAPGYTITWYVTFVWAPKRVREEAQRLREVEQSMRDDTPFG